MAPQGSAVSDSFALPCYFSPWKLSCGNELLFLNPAKLVLTDFLEDGKEVKGLEIYE